MLAWIRQGPGAVQRLHQRGARIGGQIEVDRGMPKPSAILTKSGRP
jgi:hypothetical protein